MARAAGPARAGHPGLDLDEAAGTGDECPRRRDAAARDEEGAHESLLGRRNEDAHLERAQAFELREPADDLLERGHAVAQPRGVLEAQVGGEPPQAHPQRRQGGGEIVSRMTVERAGGQPGEPAAADRPERPRRRARHEAGAPAAEVDVAVRPRRADVARRAQLPQQAQLLERQLRHAHRADLDDPIGTRPQSRRLEVEDGIGRGLETELLAGRSGEADGCPAPGEPRVARDDAVEQLPREPGREVAERIERPRGILRGDGRPALGDQLDEAIGGVEGKLHRPILPERLFAHNPPAGTQ